MSRVVVAARDDAGFRAEEACDDGRDRFRYSPGAGHLRRARRRDGRGHARADRACGPARAATVSGVAAGGPGRRGVGGDDGLAVHRRGAGRRRCDRSSRRAGGDGQSARAQGAREDRPRRRASPARVVAAGSAAGGVGAAGGDPRAAPAGAAAQDAHRRAHRLAAADPRAAVPSRRRPAAGAADRRGPCRARAGGAVAERAARRSRWRWR